MRIAYFTETYFPQLNGVTYTLAGWKRELERRGHEVHVVYPGSEHEPEDGEHPVGSLGFKPVDGYRIGIGFPPDVDEALPEVDVVHAHGPFTLGWLGSELAQRRGCPFFVTHHTPVEKYFVYLTDSQVAQQLMDRVYGWWEDRFYGAADIVLAPSGDASRRLARRIDRAVVPFSNGTDTTFFSPTASDFRNRYGLVREDPLVGFCGRLGYEKNLEDLLAFAERFRGQVVVAGDGFARDHYEPLFEAAGVRYLGRLPRREMPEFYSSLDLFLIPSIGETQGVSVLEANACGTPAVGADKMGLRDTIRSGVNGLRYPPGDVDALAERVEEALADLPKLQRGARKIAEENGVGRVIDRLEELYRLASRSGGARMSTERWAEATAPVTRPPP